MRTIEPPSLVLGKVEFAKKPGNLQVATQQGLVFVLVAGAVLRLRSNSRVVQKKYLQEGARYAIAYVSDGYADTVTALVRNPGINKFQEMQRRQLVGALPTREVWKKMKPKKKSLKMAKRYVLTYIV